MNLEMRQRRSAFVEQTVMLMLNMDYGRGYQSVRPVSNNEVVISVKEIITLSNAI